MDTASKLKEAIGELGVMLQGNTDALQAAMEKRELTHWAPAHSDDIEDRYLRILQRAENKGKEAFLNKLTVLTAGPERENITAINLFTKTISANGKKLHVPDEDVIAFLFADVLKQSSARVASWLVKAEHGLPSSERTCVVSELDEQIAELETEQQGLYQQARDAGLSISERLVTN